VVAGGGRKMTLMFVISAAINMYLLVHCLLQKWDLNMMKDELKFRDEEIADATRLWTDRAVEENNLLPRKNIMKKLINADALKAWISGYAGATEAIEHHTLIPEDAICQRIDEMQDEGCARGQNTTQYCAEAVAAQAELHRLNVALDDVICELSKYFDVDRAEQTYTKAIELIKKAREL